MSEEREKSAAALNSADDGHKFYKACPAEKSSTAVSSDTAEECTLRPCVRSAAMIPKSKARIVSERKLRANRANARKSTGPRTARGKAYSRRNALLHGLTSRTVLFDPQGTQLDPGLQNLLRNLEQNLAKGPNPDPKVKTVVHEYTHLCLATEIEARLAQNGLDDIAAPVSVRNLMRYRTASERALLKSITPFER